MLTYAINNTLRDEQKYGFRGKSDIFENRNVSNPSFAYSPMKKYSTEVNIENYERAIDSLQDAYKYPDHREKWLRWMEKKRKRIEKE